MAGESDEEATTTTQNPTQTNSKMNGSREKILLSDQMNNNSNNNIGNSKSGGGGSISSTSSISLIANGNAAKFSLLRRNLSLNGNENADHLDSSEVGSTKLRPEGSTHHHNAPPPNGGNAITSNNNKPGNFESLLFLFLLEFPREAVKTIHFMRSN